MNLCEPTTELVRRAISDFEKDAEATEKVLRYLFDLFPTNTDLDQVRVKVKTLNTLYSTQIRAVEIVANHIQQNGEEIDRALAKGLPEVVSKIAKVKVKKGEEERNFFSFATKYCSWHRPDAYVIYDRFVEKYLWTLQKKVQFTKQPFKRKDLRVYPKLAEVIDTFRTYYRLEQFSFKEIDKFLWHSGNIAESSMEMESDKTNPATDISLTS